MQESQLRDLSKEFAKDIIKLCRELKHNAVEGALLNQLLRCGTSIGANIHEAQYAQGRKDFISDFADAGINQTLHRLYMRIVVNMKIILPGYSLSFDNGSTVLICENIISGDVPLGELNIGENLLP